MCIFEGDTVIKVRARKLYTSARIYEWKFGKGEWKLPFASPTGRVDLFGFVIIFEEKKRTNWHVLQPAKATQTQ